MNPLNKISLFFTKFSLFIRQNYSSFFFTFFFYSLLFCIHYLQHVDLSLHSFPGRMMGQATAGGIDVGKRVHVFYISLFILVAINTGLCLAAFKLHVKHSNLFKEARIFNVLSIAGCVLLFLHAFDYTTHNSINLILLLQAIALVFSVIKIYVLPQPVNKLFDATLFSTGVYLSFCSFFLIKESAYLFALNLGPDSILAIIASFSAFYFLLFALLIKRRTYNQALVFWTKTIWVLLPLIMLPLFSALKDETYLILNRRGIHSLTPMRIYLALLLLTILWTYIRSRKPAEKLLPVNPFSLLSNYYFPFLVLSVTICFFYSPFYVNASVGMFEPANRFLPVSELFHFHIIPMIEKFNSHLLDDFSTIFLYSVLNGLRGMEPLIYDFIFPVTQALITYFIIKDLTRNPYVALFFVMFFPFTEQLIPVDFAPALIATYALYKFNCFAPSVKHYLLLFATSIFLLLWRVDVGVASIFSIVGIVLIYIIAGNVKLNRKILITSSIYLFSSILLVLILLLFKGVNFKTSFLEFYNYLSSAQAYGFSVLADNPLSKQFQMQHYVFPVICLLLTGYILLHFKSLTSEKNLKFAVILFLFCLGFYFANFQRGLVRHSFLERLDKMLSSYAFLIITGSCYLFFLKKSHTAKFLIFFFAGFFLITGFHFPEPHPKIPYELFYPKLSDNAHIQRSNNIERELNSSLVKKNYKDFQNFISAELKGDETFIDFTETPMLYYFTHKEIPCYFYQGTENIINDYLQERFIANLTNYKVPLLVSTKFPVADDSWAYNNPWAVPIPLENYKIAEYCFQHYKPFAIVQNSCLWEQNQTHLKNDTTHYFYFKQDTLYSRSQNDFNKKAIDSFTAKNAGVVLISIKHPAHSTIKNYPVYTKNNDTLKEKAEALFSDTLSNTVYYVIKHENNDFFKLYLNSTDGVRGIKITDTKYIPDFYSTIPHKWYVGMIPFIWGTYDKKIASAIIQNTLSNSDTVINTAPVLYNLPAQIDKSTGNYIAVFVEANNDHPIDIRLTYGPSNGEIIFVLPEGKGVRKLVVRISAQYNWYAKENRIIQLYSPGNESVHVKKVLLLKGD